MVCPFALHKLESHRNVSQLPLFGRGGCRGRDTGPSLVLYQFPSA
jgi:hypothetical protein